MSQTNEIYALLTKGPVRTDEIVNKVYGPQLNLARVSARIYDVKKQYGIPKIHSWPDDQNKKLWWYSLRPRELRLF